MVHLDLVGGLPRSEEGYEECLVMTDAVTKFTVAVPVKNKEQNTIARKFVLFLPKPPAFGPPSAPRRIKVLEWILIFFEAKFDFIDWDCIRNNILSCIINQYYIYTISNRGARLSVP